ncbi:MAG: transcriptional repressor [Bacteroidales bacterium]|nr:transcriptional repressor [Bacteroidales bacterium]
MKTDRIKSLLQNNGLKVTPQRLAVLEAVSELKNHPTADQINEYIRTNHPNIATGTVYKTLETFVGKGMIKKVKTEKDIMRYDAILEKHHHLYSSESERIEDFYDQELNQLIDNYFKNKDIPNFKIEDIKLQIIGKFTDSKNFKNHT